MGTKFILGQEDGTAAGGNARGQAAVDLQTSRANANEVASGQQSVIIGGYNNRASGIFSIAGGGQNIATNQYALCLGGGFNTSSGGFSTVIGGSGNTASSNFTTVSGGESNTAGPGSWTTVGGGSTNTASSNYSVVSGGQSNTASTNTHATVVGGQGNVSSGAHSISGGNGNTASGQQAVSIGGNSNIASAYASYALGETSQATANYAVAIGNSARATSTNAIAFGIQNYATGISSVAFGGASTNAYIPYCISTGDAIITRGDSQFTSYITRVSSILTSGGTVNLSNSGGYLQGLPNGNNRMWKVKVEYVGTITTITGTATGLTVGDSVYGEENFGFKKLSGTSTMGPIMNETQSSDNAIMDTCSLAVTAGASQEMALTFTGPTFAGGGSVTMRVVAKVALVEVAF